MSTPFWAPPPEKYPGPLPEKADVLVIGGGIAGTSLLWHLAARRIPAVLVEREHIAWGRAGATRVFSSLAWRRATRRRCACTGGRRRARSGRSPARTTTG